MPLPPCLPSSSLAQGVSAQESLQLTVIRTPWGCYLSWSLLIWSAVSCCRGCLGVFVGVVEVAGRALQPFLPFPKQILSSFAICRSTRLSILFSSSRRLAQKLQAFFVRKKKKKKQTLRILHIQFRLVTSFLAIGTCPASILTYWTKKKKTRAEGLVHDCLFPLHCLSLFHTGNRHNSLFLFCLSLDCQHHTARDGTTRGPKKKKTAREWTQGPHQREHGTNLIN